MKDAASSKPICGLCGGRGQRFFIEQYDGFSSEPVWYTCPGCAGSGHSNAQQQIELADCIPLGELPLSADGKSRRLLSLARGIE